MFANREGRFLDASGISGLDDPADGRGAAWLDYDRDGWLDFAVVNANAPTLQLFRNQLGDDGATSSDVLAVRLIGGNTAAAPSAEWSSRDAYGARIEIALGDRTLVREKRAGEGFATQNSDTVLIGLGSSQQGDLRVVWPSGRSQDLGTVRAGSLITAYEDPAAAPSGEPKAKAYRLPDGRTARGRVAFDATELRLAPAEHGAALRLYTTMATWCETCRGELPRLAELRRTFGADQISFHGVPWDLEESRAQLERYVVDHGPPYEMLLDLEAGERAAMREIFLRELRRDPIPSAIVADRQGRPLSVTIGLPPVSTLRRLLAESTGAALPR